MDDARLREPENFFGKDYFEEQLERIRDNRASERRFYQKITDIYSQCSADYDVESPITKEFLRLYLCKAIVEAHGGSSMLRTIYRMVLCSVLPFRWRRYNT